MRILAFSDIHGAYAKTEEILDRESAYDIILICGDVTTRGTPEEAKNAVAQIRTHGKPVFVVSGNMDSPEIDTAFINSGCCINAQGIILNDIGFFGVSAAPFSRLRTPYEISEDEIFLRAKSGWHDVQSARRKVFVPQCTAIRHKTRSIDKWNACRQYSNQNIY